MMAYGYALALGIQNIPLEVFFIYVPVGFLIMTLPISLAGWGVGEATYSYLFAKVGVPASKAVVLSILVRCGQMFISLFGGIWWLFDRRKPSIEETEKILEGQA